jgi:anti-anti-sigma factor
VAPRLDLSGLSFMDSQGVGLLVDLGAMARSRGLAVVVERLSPAARRVLEVTLPGGIPGVEFLG